VSSLYEFRLISLILIFKVTSDSLPDFATPPADLHLTGDLEKDAKMLVEREHVDMLEGEGADGLAGGIADGGLADGLTFLQQYSEHSSHSSAHSPTGRSIEAELDDLDADDENEDPYPENSQWEDDENSHWHDVAARTAANDESGGSQSHLEVRTVEGHDLDDDLDDFHESATGASGSGSNQNTNNSTAGAHSNNNNYSGSWGQSSFADFGDHDLYDDDDADLRAALYGHEHEGDDVHASLLQQSDGVREGVDEDSFEDSAVYGDSDTDSESLGQDAESLGQDFARWQKSNSGRNSDSDSTSDPHSKTSRKRGTYQRTGFRARDPHDNNPDHILNNRQDFYFDSGDEHHAFYVDGIHPAIHAAAAKYTHGRDKDYVRNFAVDYAYGRAMYAPGSKWRREMGWVNDVHNDDRELEELARSAAHNAGHNATHDVTDATANLEEGRHEGGSQKGGSQKGGSHKVEDGSHSLHREGNHNTNKTKPHWSFVMKNWKSQMPDFSFLKATHGDEENREPLWMRHDRIKAETQERETGAFKQER
jgi:hypothetical protein